MLWYTESSSEGEKSNYKRKSKLRLQQPQRFKTEISTPPKELISKYGYFSGYEINIDKTDTMDVNGNILLPIKRSSGFKWPTGGIEYLGIPRSFLRLILIILK